MGHLTGSCMEHFNCLATDSVLFGSSNVVTEVAVEAVADISAITMPACHARCVGLGTCRCWTTGTRLINSLLI